MHKSLFVFLLIFYTFCIYANDSDCELINQTAIYTISGVKLTEESTTLLQINNRMGDKYGNIRIPYSKKNKVIIQNAQIEDLFGNVIRTLKKSEITDQSSISDISLYEDDFIKKFTLRHNFYPYRIRYSIKYTYNEFLEIAHWYPAIDNDVPTRNAKLEIHAPVNYRIIFLRNGIAEPQIDSLQNEIVYTFIAKDIILPKAEYYCPPLNRLLPYVRAVPQNFTYISEGSHINWIEYGNWENKITDGLDELPVEDKTLVKTLINGKTNPLDIISTLYYYMQDNMRYINITVNVGGLVPYPASYVSKNRYGDCKALSVYMKALLKEAGIASNYASVFAGDAPPIFIENFPSHQANHMFLVVPLAKDTVYLECTSNRDPAGYQGTFTQGRKALIIEKDNSKIITLPALSINDVLESQSIKYSVLPEGKCNVEMNAKYKGYKYDYFNSAKTALNNKEIEEHIREKILKFPAFEIVNWELKTPFRDSSFILFNTTLKLENYLKKYGNDYGFGIVGLSLPNFEKPGIRKLPVYFEWPIHKCDTFSIQLSQEYKIKSIPENFKLTTAFGNYSISYTQNNNNINIIRNFLIHKGEYAVADYKNFYSFITSVLQAENKLILLSKN